MPRPRLAWFSPMPPARTGIATDSTVLVAGLRDRYDIEVFVDAAAAPPPGTRSAHDFLWTNQQRPFDLVLYQLGNSAEHEYAWPYLFRYPGLAVLHDARLHHARAATLLRARRAPDYRAEFAANHPDVAPELAEVGVAGLDSYLYYQWPMTRLVIERSRLTAVHSQPLARELQGLHPDAAIETIRLGHGTPLAPSEVIGHRRAIRARYGIPDAAPVFGCFGGLSPEKRIPQVLRAFAALSGHGEDRRLLLAGAPAAHYDLERDVASIGGVIQTGYLDADEELTAHIAACDVAVAMRWPTAREMSGPWLRCLAAGIPTIVMQLAQLTDVPWLDPRIWLPSASSGSEPVCVAVDVLDEDHSLRLAMRRLAQDAALRARLGAAGRAWWDLHHTPAGMIADYHRIIERALALPAAVPPRDLPAHLVPDGHERLRALLEPLGTPDPLR